MNDEIVDRILNDPELLKECLESMMSSDSPDHEARVALGAVEHFTGQRRKEILETIQSEIEEAINRGSLHRFSGFLDSEPE